jgi:hypothetical protein
MVKIGMTCRLDPATTDDRRLVFVGLSRLPYHASLMSLR